LKIPKGNKNLSFKEAQTTQCPKEKGKNSILNVQHYHSFIGFYSGHQNSVLRKKNSKLSLFWNWAMYIYFCKYWFAVFKEPGIEQYNGRLCKNIMAMIEFLYKIIILIDTLTDTN
jgi:hypothetical protein